MAEYKTNVMRLLQQKKVSFTAHEYAHEDAAVDGVSAAALIGRDPSCVFKTLVARGASKNLYVFVIPVAHELDLKKAAKAAGEKSIAMIHVTELNPLTGYVRGGCSPIGMKKKFKTFYHESIETLKTVCVSAGKIGYQVELAPSELISLTDGIITDITVGAE